MAKILFFGGKGGVGKTSCSTAYAIANAKKAKKTLLVSTDPAHSISDLFNINIGSSITYVNENLFGIEIDPKKESEEYINQIKSNLSDIISPIILEEINKQLDMASVSPGSHESALFDKIVEIVLDETEQFDTIIFDTAPTGHTIRLLSLPELLSGWMDLLIKKRKKGISFKKMINKKQNEDPVLEILNRRKIRFERARILFVEDKDVTFKFVTNAEKMPIEETKKSIILLNKYGINVSSIIINKILPDESNDEFWKNKKDKEKKHILKLKNEMPNYEYIQIPLYNSDMDEENINLMANYIFNII
jgi:arsenite-transporting ATPase